LCSDEGTSSRRAFRSRDWDWDFREFLAERVGSPTTGGLPESLADSVEATSME
jgi:hypothetical protein